MIRVLACAALVAMLLTSMSYAFEVDEFKSGMHVTDALSVAKKKDPDSYVDELDNDNSIISINKGNDGDSVIRWHLMFCNDKLVSLARWYRLDWKVLADIVHDMNKIYGKGYVVKHVFKLKGHRSVGLGSIENVGIQIEWRNRLESVYVSIAHVAYIEYSGGDTDRGREKESQDMSEHYMLRVKGGCPGSK